MPLIPPFFMRQFSPTKKHQLTGFSVPRPSTATAHPKSHSLQLTRDFPIRVFLPQPPWRHRHLVGPCGGRPFSPVRPSSCPSNVTTPMAGSKFSLSHGPSVSSATVSSYLTIRAVDVRRSPMASCSSSPQLSPRQPNARPRLPSRSRLFFTRRCQHRRRHAPGLQDAAPGRPLDPSVPLFPGYRTATWWSLPESNVKSSRARRKPATMETRRLRPRCRGPSPILPTSARFARAVKRRHIGGVRRNFVVPWLCAAILK